jgi:tungstate transport system substrate-binding protein
LKILVEGGAELINVYHVIDIAKSAGSRVNAPGGKGFADWIVSPATQKVIRTFGAKQYGHPLFVPDAGKTDGQILQAA